jgi:glyoxylase-like metal-dependent hydrolase (beta-lactamase superfamily II)
VRQVVLTHCHADHAGSAREVSAWPGVRVAAHHADARVVRGETRGEWPDFTPAERDLHAVVGAGLPDPPDVPQARVDIDLDDIDLDDIDLDDGDVLDGGLQVVWTPGHTPGSIALRHPERGLLFTGDTAAEREGAEGAVFLGPFDIDRGRARESFRRLGDPALTTECFGHGDPLVGVRTGLLRAAASAAQVPDPLGRPAPPTDH